MPPTIIAIVEENEIFFLNAMKDKYIYSHSGVKPESVEMLCN